MGYTSHSAFALLFAIVLPIHSATNEDFVSRRAKCAIECYIKCADAGTPKAVYCKCPPNSETDPCNSVNEQLLTEKTVERLMETDSGYKDIRTIWLRVESVPAAFIYIFEFSMQSADRPIWTFAGASSSPQITFAVPDACRDYQFRTIVVLRSTDPLRQLVVFRPKPIPAQFPAFTVPKESIRLDRPKQPNGDQTLHVSVSWQNPFGYDDADVYGYSPPIAYPIRCQTPEDHLSTPRLELVQGGARMHLELPIAVLRERCRIYMEVRMLPRCVRIEPFDVQISVELDCKKFPELPFCQKEHGPKCTDVVDLWGKDNGKVIVVWQRPNGDRPRLANPLFYIVNWGTTQSQDNPPFVTHRIVEPIEVRVPGNLTKVELSDVQPGVQYGLQICAFFTSVHHPLSPNSDPFRIVPVIPFTCIRCKQKAANAPESCIDCSKIEETNRRAPTSSSSFPNSVHFISSDTVVLDVFGANVSTAPGEEEKEEADVMPNNDEREGKEEIGETMTEQQMKMKLRDEEAASNELQPTTTTVPLRKSSSIGSDGGFSSRRRSDWELITTKWERTEEAWTEVDRKTTEIPIKMENWRNITVEETSSTVGTTEMEEMGRRSKDQGWKEDKMEVEGTLGLGQNMEQKRVMKKDEEEEERRKKKNDEEEEERKKKTDEEEDERNKKNEEEEERKKTKMEAERSKEALALINSDQQLKGSSADADMLKGLATHPINTMNGTKTESKMEEKSINQPSKGGLIDLVESDGERRNASSAIGKFDRRKWMLAAPALFLFGLFAGLALLLTVLFRRRTPYPHHRPTSIPSTRKFVGGGRTTRLAVGRSVLAARTMDGCYVAGGTTTATMGFVGTPKIGIIGPTNGCSPASSASSSGASSASTMESRLGTLGTTGSSPQGGLMPAVSANFFADNTARFFMHPPNSQFGNPKNVHF